jgi:hypothetical protein
MEHFWLLTPREFHFCYEAWANVRKEDYQSSWEQTRMILYYQFCSYPKKGQNPSYNKFKQKHIQFPWDLIAKDVVDDYEEKEQPLSIDQWADIISKLKPVKNLNGAEVHDIK